MIPSSAGGGLCADGSVTHQELRGLLRQLHALAATPHHRLDQQRVPHPLSLLLQRPRRRPSQSGRHPGACMHDDLHLP